MSRFDASTGRAFAVVVRLALGLALVWSGLAKLDDPIAFLQAVYRYEIAGPALGWWVAAALPYLEVVFGLSLVTGLLSGAAGWLAAGLGAVFVFAQAWAMARGLAIECGCFGSAGEVVGWESMGRALMVACAGVLVGAASHQQDEKRAPNFAGGSEPPAASTARQSPVGP